MLTNVAFAAAIIAAIGGCDTTGCHCPAGGCDNCSSISNAETVVTPVLSDIGSISGVSADAPCSASLQNGGDRILINRLGPGACTVHVVLSNAVTEAATVTFSPVSAACGCYLGASAAMFGPVDASPSQ